MTPNNFNMRIELTSRVPQFKINSFKNYIKLYGVLQKLKKFKIIFDSQEFSRIY